MRRSRETATLSSMRSRANLSRGVAATGDAARPARGKRATTPRQAKSPPLVAVAPRTIVLTTGVAIAGFVLVDGSSPAGCARARRKQDGRSDSPADDADREVARDGAADRRRDPTAGLAQAHARVLRRELEHRIEPLPASELHEQGEECDGDAVAYAARTVLLQLTVAIVLAMAAEPLVRVFDGAACAAAAPSA
jgi:hypothetical protein